MEESFRGLIIDFERRKAMRKSPGSRISGLALNPGPPELERGLDGMEKWATYSWNLAYCRGWQ